MFFIKRHIYAPHLPCLYVFILSLLAPHVGASQETYSSIQHSSFKAHKAPETLLLDIQAQGATLVAVGQRGHVIVSSDSGNDFQLRPTPINNALTSVTAIDNTTWVAVGHHLQMIRSADNGQHWTAIELEQTDSAPWLDVFAVNEQSLIAVGAYGYYAQSEDKGITWTFSQPTETDFHINSITALTSERLIMAGESGTIYTSIDQGQSWQSITGLDRASIFSVTALNSDTALFLTLGGVAFKGKPFSENPQWQIVEFEASRSLFDAVLHPQHQSLWVVGAAGQMRFQKAFNAINESKVHTLDRTDRRDILAALWLNDTLWTVGELGLRAFNSKGLSQSYQFTP